MEKWITIWRQLVQHMSIQSGPLGTKELITSSVNCVLAHQKYVLTCSRRLDNAMYKVSQSQQTGFDNDRHQLVT